MIYDLGMVHFLVDRTAYGTKDELEEAVSNFMKKLNLEFIKFGSKRTFSATPPQMSKPTDTSFTSPLASDQTLQSQWSQSNTEFWLPVGQWESCGSEIDIATVRGKFILVHI